MPRKPKSAQPDDWSTPKNWPATKVEMRPLSWIKPYDMNPRSHPPAQIELIASSMREDGVTTPILVDDEGIVIAGHGRRMAALQNGYYEYPVVIVKDWSEDKKRAYRIKDNSYGELSSWDKDLIKGELTILSTGDYDLKLLGFGDAQLVQFTTLPMPPNEFATVGSDLKVDHQCPRCGYVGSGDWTPKKAKEKQKRKSRKKSQ